jgi:mercuric ion transport protein
MGRLMAWVGGIGTAFGLLCCFTPLLPVLLTAVGAVTLIEPLYRDAILLPFAAGSFVLMGVGLWLMRKSN